MKTDVSDLSETRKSLAVEVPSDTVDAEIDRVARDYGRAAKIPGFRPGKVPVRLVKQRFRDQILHDVANEIVPRVMEQALRERQLEPVDTPDIKDVVISEGQPLKFTAVFDTLPPIDPGPYDTISVRRPPAVVEADAVDRTIKQLRDRAARFEPADDREIGSGDTVTLDLSRRAGEAAEADRHENVSIDVGALSNPPGFDEALIGLRVGAEKTFTVHYPAEYAIKTLAGTDVEYRVTVKAIRHRVLPELDDEFARDVGDFETLDALRERVRQDLLREAEANADRQVRSDLLKALSGRVTVEVPESMVERELDRRTEEFARRLAEQQIDLKRTSIDWDSLRNGQRDASRESVKGAIMLDEIARREGLAVTDEDVSREVSTYAERLGRTEAAVRAQLEKEGALSRLSSGLLREKALDFLMTRVTIARE